MPVQIFQPYKKETHPLQGKDLQPGLIYEGTDGLLYVGINHSAIRDAWGNEVHADGINHDAYAHSGDHGDLGELSFREVNATITYK